MEFVILQSFTNYMDAHILKGRMEQEGIRCWLKDENTVTIDPILTNAVGGIKLMVPSHDYKRAYALWQDFMTQKREAYACPKCGSHNIEFVSSPRKLSNWIGAIAGTFFGDLAIGVNKTWRCFECEAEFEEPEEENHS